MSDVTSIAGIRGFRIGDYFAVLKPRVMSLVVFTAAIGLYAAGANLSVAHAIAIIVLIAIGGGGSGALNMWLDADIDAKMRRTAARPIPSGRLSGRSVRNFGLALSVGSVVLLGLVANLAAGALLAFTIFFYVVVYTVWLKRNTPWNIVIGGAAGAFPPMIGWVAATGNLSIEAVLMFALVFMWTPPHFWSLALFTKNDYTRAKVPMLTVTHGRPETRRQIAIYTLALTPTSLALAFSPIGGPIYLLVALWLNFGFVKGALHLRRRDEQAALADRFAIERRFFKLSLFYLFGLFAALAVEAGLRQTGFEVLNWSFMTSLVPFGAGFGGT